MSHTTTLKGVAIRDVSAMRAAVADLVQKGVKCSLLENATPRMYYRDQERDVGKCDYVLKLDDSRYDVGFKKQEDGTYAAIFDEWANSVGNQLGAACPLPNTAEGKAQHQIGQFMQSYATHAAMNAAAAEGYTVTGTTTDADGNVHLEIAV